MKLSELTNEELIEKLVIYSAKEATNGKTSKTLSNKREALEREILKRLNAK